MNAKRTEAQVKSVEGPDAPVPFDADEGLSGQQQDGPGSEPDTNAQAAQKPGEGSSEAADGDSVVLATADPWVASFHPGEDFTDADGDTLVVTKRGTSVPRAQVDGVRRAAEASGVHLTEVSN